MIARIVLAVMLCGIAAGLVMGVMQHARLTPIILQAETFETAAASTPHSHDATAPAEHHHDENAWMPKDGLERTAYTFAASMLAAAGFSGILAGVAFLLGLPITKDNGWVWGLCGFLAFSLAPSAGLPPELPGMPAADVTMRQLWWLLTVVSTGVALWLLATKRQSWAAVVALVVAVLPHVIGAPQAAEHTSLVPAPLAAHFAGFVIGANAVMWLIIGTLLGRFLPQQDLDNLA
jgi:cobalt transporter subunit CbtA